eukprot:1070864-Alexandrium_andersonii.AAC.1
MSASLVGSEMCIRDSVKERDQPCLEPEPDQVLVEGVAQGAHERVLVPVSYTHLTLPTICSV